MQLRTGLFCLWCQRSDDVLVVGPCGHRYICKRCFNLHAHDTCLTCRQQIQTVRVPTENVANRVPILDRQILDCTICGERMQPLLLLPCLHHTICGRCMEQTERRECPYCRAGVKMVRFPGARFRSMDTVMQQYALRRQEDEANILQAVIVGSCLQTKQNLKRLILTHCQVDTANSSRAPTRCSANCGLAGNFQTRLFITLSTEADEEWDEEITPLNPQVILIVSNKQGDESAEEYDKWLTLCTLFVGTNIIFIEMDGIYLKWSPSTHISMEDNVDSVTMWQLMTFHDHVNAFGIRNLFRFVWDLPRSGVEEAGRLVERAVVRRSHYY